MRKVLKKEGYKVKRVCNTNVLQLTNKRNLDEDAKNKLKSIA